jgi:hypothetical protein
MPSRRRRDRHTGRRESGQHYALVYDEIMQSEAWRALPAFAQSLYTAIAAQFRGANNGDLDFPASKARLYGVSHKNLAAGIPLLEEVGLIVKTRQGRLDGGRKLCSLYALTCWPVEASDKYDQPLVIQRPASNVWARWTPTPEWSQTVRTAKRKAAGRKFQTPHGGKESHPHVGNGRDAPHSSRAERWHSHSDPHVRSSSRDLGRGDIKDKVEAFLRMHPEMSDVDVAVAFKWKVSQFDVVRIRQSLSDTPGGVRDAH